MNKQQIREIRDKMINKLWEEKRAEWEMKDLAKLFNLSIPQIYRIIKAVSQQCETEVQGSHKTGSKENLKETNAA